VSAVLGIARQEVSTRRFLLAAAAALSLLAWALRAVLPPGWSRELGQSLALVLFLAFPIAAAIAVGSSLVGRDLAEGRLSFYFSRPLSAGALWAGKFLGGAILVAGAFLCCYLPLALSGGGIGRAAVGIWLLALIGLMAFAHTVSSMYRSGSRLFALDLAFGAVLVTVIVVQVRALALAGAGHVLLTTAALPIDLAVAAAAMLAAAAAQLAYGRADARRGHIALSTAVWTLALVAVVALAPWSRWVLGVTPADVGGVGYPLLAAPGGSAFLFKGPSARGRAGFSPVFLMDGESGAYVRLAPERVTFPAFSADGSAAVWVAPAVSWWWYVAPEPGLLFPGVEARRAALAVARLGPGTPVVEERALEPPDAELALALDGDGQRVLVSGHSGVSLVDVASGRLVADAPLSNIWAADFLPGGAVRFYQTPRDGAEHAFVVLDWTPKDGKRVERARVPVDPPVFLLARRGDLAVVSTGMRGKAIIDTASGAVRRLDSAAKDVPGAALVLSSGLVALSLGEEVRIVTPGGDVVARLPLEPRTSVYALCEPAPGELAVGLWSLALDRRRTMFVDAATGQVRREEEGLLPAGPRYGGMIPRPQPEPGSFASRLFTGPGGELVALEPDGRKRQIVGVAAR
jgi:hypothetical protein